LDALAAGFAALLAADGAGTDLSQEGWSR